ncbi:MAG: DUF2974 domain-containing protein [Treponema sp.]|nr:DUF2974 domain-containing protein [Treponema sp.]
MQDFFDYLKWRGDLSFENSPFNSIDALILCQIAYLDFSGLVSESFKDSILLSEAASLFFENKTSGEQNPGLMINTKTLDLLSDCAQSKRFGDVKLCGYVNHYNQDITEQFCAISFLYDNKKVFIAFRGTDDTIVGWKEDFELAFKESVPSQKDAVEYLENALNSLKYKEITVGGHSKGGNLSIYAAAHIKESSLKKLNKVLNFDGPGFLKEVLDSLPFQKVMSRTESFYPQGSVIGMLFEHDPNYCVVHSDGVFVMQHDPFTWNLFGPQFALDEQLDKSSQFFNSTFNEWFVALSPDNRRQFVETIFGVLESTGATTNSELAENWLKSAGAMIKAFSSLDKDIRKSAMDTMDGFFKLVRQNLPQMLKK